MRVFGSTGTTTGIKATLFQAPPPRRGKQSAPHVQCPQPCALLEPITSLLSPRRHLTIFSFSRRVAPTLPFAVSLTPDYGARSSPNAEKLSALPLFPIVMYLRAPPRREFCVASQYEDLRDPHVLCPQPCAPLEPIISLLSPPRHLTYSLSHAESRRLSFSPSR